MKTITLDEEAYALLKSWKRSGRESFSAVVKQVVPKPGTLGALLGFVETLDRGNPAADARMEEVIEQRSSVKEDPWIGACALTATRPLLTRNRRHFDLIPGLAVHALTEAN